jgi:hypothetical protein
MLEPKGNCSPVRKELRWFFYVLITLNIPSYERGVARVLGYDLPP